MTVRVVRVSVKQGNLQVYKVTIIKLRLQRYIYFWMEHKIRGTKINQDRVFV